MSKELFLTDYIKDNRDSTLLIIKPGTYPIKNDGDKVLFWNNDTKTWIEDIRECFKTIDVKELEDVLISMSALDEEGQPALWQWVPYQLDEGPNKGMWVLKAKVLFMERQPY